MANKKSKRIPIGVLHKSYGEFKIEIPHGLYTVIEIERILRSAKIAIEATKEITDEMINNTKEMMND